MKVKCALGPGHAAIALHSNAVISGESFAGFQCLGAGDISEKTKPLQRCFEDTGMYVTKVDNVCLSRKEFEKTLGTIQEQDMIVRTLHRSHRSGRTSHHT